MDDTTYDVIIIGAGISGLSSALHISQQCPSTSILVLEAQNRIGGRISQWKPSAASSDAHVFDIGAAWIHGTEGNPLVDLLTEAVKPEYSDRILAEIAAKNPWVYPAPENICFGIFHGDEDEECGYQQPDETTVNAALQCYQKLKEKAKIEAEKCCLEEDVTTPASTCWLWIPEIIIAVKATMGKEIMINDSELRNLFSWLIKNIELWMGTDLENLQLSSLAMDELWGDFPGKHCLVKNYDATEASVENNHIPGIACVQRFSDLTSVPFGECHPRGMKTIVDALVAKLSENDAKNSGRISLLLNSQAEKIQALKFITVPPPAIKSVDLEICPKFPEWKTNALDTIRLGVYTKLILYFDCEWRFWSETAPYFWALCDGETTGATKPSYVENYYSMKGVPALVAVFIGESGLAAERKDEQWRKYLTVLFPTFETWHLACHIAAVVDTAMAQIKLFATKCLRVEAEKIPSTPKDFHVTRWSSNRWSKGAYNSSYLNVGLSAIEDYRIPLVAESDNWIPLEGKYYDLAGPSLHFAGDAAHEEYDGSLHGAYMTGQTVAEEIQNRYQNRCSR